MGEKYDILRVSQNVGLISQLKSTMLGIKKVDEKYWIVADISVKLEMFFMK